MKKLIKELKEIREQLIFAIETGDDLYVRFQISRIDTLIENITNDQSKWILYR